MGRMKIQPRLWLRRAQRSDVYNGIVSKHPGLHPQESSRRQSQKSSWLPARGHRRVKPRWCKTWESCWPNPAAKYCWWTRTSAARICTGNSVWPNEWGLIDLLCEDLPLSEYPLDRLAIPTGLPGLAILPNRVTQNNVAKALYSPRFRAVLENLSKHYDMILVDAPPILSVADARIIAPLTDSLILVLRCGVTDRESAMEAYQRIQDDGVSLLGTILTDYNLSADRRRQILLRLWRRQPSLSGPPRPHPPARRQERPCPP